MVSFLEIQAVFAILFGEVFMFQLAIFLVGGLAFFVARFITSFFNRRPLTVWLRKDGQ